MTINNDTAKNIHLSEVDRILGSPIAKFGKGNQCEGKRGYKKINSALRVIGEMTVKGKNKDNTLMAYKCPHCGKFHVGNFNARNTQEPA